MQYCVHGGPEMIVHVRDGRLGHALWSVPCPGTVWSLAISDDAADAPKLVVAGDFHGVSVYDLKTHRCELRLLQQKTVQGTAITKDSICYTSGSFTHVYGQGGTHYSWRERPSFAHILRTMAISTDDQHVPFLGVMLEQHPALANARDPATGESLLQEIVQSGYADHSQMLSHLLQSKCQIGLRPDFIGLNALSVALEKNKLHPVRSILKAIRAGRVTPTPLCIALVSRSLAALATQFPMELIQLIKEMPLEDEPEVLTNTAFNDLDVSLPQLLTKGSELRSPKGIWEDDLAEYRRSTEHSLDQVHSSEGLAVERRTAARHTAARRSSNGMRVADSFIADRELTAQEGFPRVVRGGLRALRVPFENFAGRLECDGGAHTTVLQLVVDAVTVTRDYSVFGTRSMQILLDFKWRRFARRSFLRKLFFFLAHLLWTTSFTLQASQILDERLAPSHIRLDQHWFLLLGWMQTTVVSLIYLRACIRQARSWGIARYVRDGPEMNNLLYNLMQLLVNILFWLREFTPPFVFAPGRFNGTEVGGGAAGAGEPGADGEIDWSSLREKEQVESDESSPLGLYVTLQSWVMVALFMRALFFFRGFRSFAALFNIAVETTRAVMPFLVLLTVVTFGFSLGTHLLLQHTVFGSDPNYDDPLKTISTVWNAGFRFIPPKPEPMRARWQITVMYVLFMLLVQGILLNLLVAMMAGTFARLRSNAQLMAEYERAKLILQLEHVTHLDDDDGDDDGLDARAKQPPGWKYTPDAAAAVLEKYAPRGPHEKAMMASRRTSGPVHRISGIFFSEDGADKSAPAAGGEKRASWWRRCVRQRRRRARLGYYSRWLHVLMPAASGDVDEAEAGANAAADERQKQNTEEIALLQRKLSRMEEMMERLLEAHEMRGQRQQMPPPPTARAKID